MPDLSELSIVVTIHDQDLLLDYEAAGKFSSIGADLTYLFVGKGDAEKVRDLSNVVIARELDDNIEDYKYLVDFTAWYACVRNAIPLKKFVCLLQYDVVISDDFAEKTLATFSRNPEGAIGYSPVPMRDRNFIRDNMGAQPLFQGCAAVYGLDVKSILSVYRKSGLDPFWPATNNVAMPRDMLTDFVRWFTPVAMKIGNIKAVGHSFERAIKLYCVLSGRSISYLEDVLDHYQLNSHQSQDYVADTQAMHKRLLGKFR